MLPVLLLCLATASGALEPPPEPRPTVAVASLSAAPGDSLEARLVADALAANLQSSGKIRLLERSQMDRILAEQGLQASGACENGDCVVETGRLLGVQQLVVGRLSRLDDVLQLDTRLIDVGSGEVLATSSRRGTPPALKVVRPLGRLAALDLVGGGAPPGDALPESSRAWIWWSTGGALALGTAATLWTLADASGSNAPVASTIPAGSTELKVVVP